jgi:hypothetical protein
VDVVLVVVVTVLLVTTVLLVVLLVGLVRQLKLMGRSLQGLNEAMAPKLEAIARGTDDARRRVDALTELQARLQGERPNRKAGARLRG